MTIEKSELLPLQLRGHDWARDLSGAPGVIPAVADPCRVGPASIGSAGETLLPATVHADSGSTTFRPLNRALACAVAGLVAAGCSGRTATPAGGRPLAAPSAVPSVSAPPTDSTAATPPPATTQPRSATPAAAPTGVSGQSVRYDRHSNVRFGFSCQVPTSFLQQQPPANGDGFTFNGAGGAELVCFGSNNPLAISSSSAKQAHEHALAAHRTHGDTVTYDQLADNSFTLSGIQGSTGRIYYDRYLWGSGSIDTLAWSYPPSLRTALRPVVRYTAATFTPGHLSTSG